MPRTPISDELIHAPDAAARDASPTEALVALAARSALAWAREALLREAGDPVAHEWLAQARGVLRSLVREPGALDALDTHTLADELSRAVTADLPPPSDADARAHAEAFAGALVDGWLEVLEDAAARGGCALDAALLPEREAPEALEHVAALVDPFALREGELRERLEAFAREMVRERPRLPLGLVLEEREGRAWLRGEARAAEQGSGARSEDDVAHSGERRRGEEPAAPDAAKGRAPAKR